MVERSAKVSGLLSGSQFEIAPVITGAEPAGHDFTTVLGGGGDGRRGGLLAEGGRAEDGHAHDGGNGQATT